MPVNQGVSPLGHLPDPHAPLVAALVVFHRRIKRGNYHPHNTLLRKHRRGEEREGEKRETRYAKTLYLI